MEALGSRIRSHNLKLLMRSYTSISVPKVAAMLGIPQAAVAEGESYSHITLLCNNSSSSVWLADLHPCAQISTAGKRSSRRPVTPYH